MGATSAWQAASRAWLGATPAWQAASPGLEGATPAFRQRAGLGRVQRRLGRQRARSGMGATPACRQRAGLAWVQRRLAGSEPGLAGCNVGLAGSEPGLAGARAAWRCEGAPVTRRATAPAPARRAGGRSPRATRIAATTATPSAARAKSRSETGSASNGGGASSTNQRRACPSAIALWTRWSAKGAATERGGVTRRATREAEAERGDDADEPDAPGEIPVHEREDDGRAGGGGEARPAQRPSRGCHPPRREPLDRRIERPAEEQLLGERGEDHAPHQRGEQRARREGAAEGAGVLARDPGPARGRLGEQHGARDAEGDRGGGDEERGREEGRRRDGAGARSGREAERPGGGARGEEREGEPEAGGGGRDLARDQERLQRDVPLPGVGDRVGAGPLQPAGQPEPDERDAGEPEVGPRRSETGWGALTEPFRGSIESKVPPGRRRPFVRLAHIVRAMKSIAGLEYSASMARSCERLCRVP